MWMSLESLFVRVDSPRMSSVVVLCYTGPLDRRRKTAQPENQNTGLRDSRSTVQAQLDPHIGVCVFVLRYIHVPLGSHVTLECRKVTILK